MSAIVCSSLVAFVVSMVAAKSAFDEVPDRVHRVNDCIAIDPLPKNLPLIERAVKVSGDQANANATATALVERIRHKLMTTDTRATGVTLDKQDVIDLLHMARSK